VLVRAERLVAGGAALSRRDNGEIVLVRGALPGELVEVSVAAQHGAARGTLQRVLEASADRIDPLCPHVAQRCGGCDLADLGHAQQQRAKIELVVDSFRRLGKWNEPAVRPGPPLDPWGFRTTMRLAVHQGRAGLRQTASNDIVEIDHCAVAHPLLDELIVDGRYASATEVTVRVGATTGERLALVSPNRDGVHLPADVRVVGADELASGKRAWIHDDVVGRRWRISAESFFQTRPDGAAALVGAVRELAADVLDAEPVASDAVRTLHDLYSGVGLFAGALLDGRPGWRAVAIESNLSAAADARINLADVDARVVATPVERARASRAHLVIADPSRAGLGRSGTKVVAATRTDRLVLVSCDAAAAGRDLLLLAGEGYVPVESIVVDLFPHTHHVEIVTRFDRTGVS